MTTVLPSADESRAAYTRGLRELADFLDAHPDVPLPYLGDAGGRTGKPTLPIYLTSCDTDHRDKLATITRAMAAAGRRVHKHADADHHHPGYYVWCEFGGLALAARADREQVCERVVVGTETVEAEEDACPRCDGPLKLLGHDGTTVCAEAGETHYRAVKPGKRAVKAEREIVRWECTPLLAGADHA